VLAAGTGGQGDPGRPNTTRLFIVLMAQMRSKHLMGGLAALMLSALLAITLISNSQRKASPSVKIMLNFPETREPFRVFRGQELCAEGESYCE
jgi:hypothetical protein